jgi:hypothetical protein
VRVWGNLHGLKEILILMIDLGGKMDGLEEGRQQLLRDGSCDISS